MKPVYPYILVLCAAFWSCQDSSTVKEQPFKSVATVDFSHVKITDNFWAPRLKTHATTTLAVCIDQIENQTGRIRNFENAAKGEGPHSGIFYDDSDPYKAIEGIAYTLKNNPDPELEKKADEWIDKIAAAQQSDGYIYTFYTLTGLDKRWQDMDMHEMYCAGHMTEAAVAYYQSTGKRKLLDVAIRMANYMMSVFGPEKQHWVPGHEEIELALVKLYSVTKDARYLDFANWLLEERGHGHGHGYFGGANEKSWDNVYHQDDKPVREMTDIAGHAVRAMYLYCGMADVAAFKNDTGYVDALNRLWDDVVLRNMYLTGGIGSSHRNEGFTEDYDLPNYDAYCETCASVGMVYWNWRMNQFTGDSKYVDVLERSMYNGALAGISLAGDRFFYVNPLASKGSHHRRAWYGTACCPSQISRFIPSIGNYIYGTSSNAVWVNLYIGNTATFDAGKEKVSLRQETDYPWNGTIKLTVESPLKKAIRLRIPAWCKSYAITVNGVEKAATVEKGYAVLQGVWKAGDKITLSLDMPVEVVSADSRVKEDIGKRAIQRGPLVYCMEAVDNNIDFDQVALTSDTQFQTNFVSELNGIVEIKATADNKEIRFVPYYSWDNREAGEMKVWIDYREN
ncbi:hypothetical protein AGMMS50239_08690 [Bacteroidia bacterium]|nr:hypothetical protein AGMMS50239_08690 [Bacteroidia bacterium]